MSAMEIFGGSEQVSGRADVRSGGKCRTFGGAAWEFTGELMALINHGSAPDEASQLAPAAAAAASRVRRRRPLSHAGPVGLRLRRRYDEREQLACREGSVSSLYEPALGVLNLNSSLHPLVAIVRHRGAQACAALNGKT